MDLNHDFSRIAAQTRQLMTSQIRLHIKYLIQTYTISVLNLWSTDEKSRFTDNIWYDLMMIVDNH